MRARGLVVVLLALLACEGVFADVASTNLASPPAATNNLSGLAVPKLNAAEADEFDKQVDKLAQLMKMGVVAYTKHAVRTSNIPELLKQRHTAAVDKKLELQSLLSFLPDGQVQQTPGCGFLIAVLKLAVSAALIMVVSLFADALKDVHRRDVTFHVADFSQLILYTLGFATLSFCTYYVSIVCFDLSPKHGCAAYGERFISMMIIPALSVCMVGAALSMHQYMTTYRIQRQQQILEARGESEQLEARMYFNVNSQPGQLETKQDEAAKQMKSAEIEVVTKDDDTKAKSPEKVPIADRQVSDTRHSLVTGTESIARVISGYNFMFPIGLLFVLVVLVADVAFCPITEG